MCAKRQCAYFSRQPSPCLDPPHCLPSIICWLLFDAEVIRPLLHRGYIFQAILLRAAMPTCHIFIFVSSLSLFRWIAELLWYWCCHAAEPCQHIYRACHYTCLFELLQACFLLFELNVYGFLPSLLEGSLGRLACLCFFSSLLSSLTGLLSVIWLFSSEWDGRMGLFLLGLSR